MITIRLTSSFYYNQCPFSIQQSDISCEDLALKLLKAHDVRDKNEVCYRTVYTVQFLRSYDYVQTQKDQVLCLILCIHGPHLCCH